ncbi:MAG: hypothetical protein A3J83_03825 [Elusimicrobia bacterium RIFOXYA2_FULL_40_6]|nr:MAG: hypothetical protein A3J83_03825 [Elusimicrobia bacterium RIFOXYA2_FULL_40_6]
MKSVSVIRKRNAKYPAYSMVREALLALGLDPANPFGEIIKPGNKVLIKPNFVRHFHPKKKNIYSVITHPSIIRAVVDYTYIALKGKGEIIIGDAPLLDTDFEKIVKLTGLKEIVKSYKNEYNFKISILDLRNHKYDYSKSEFLPKTVNLSGDPLGYSLIDLKNRSKFAQFGPCGSLHGLDYDFKKMKEHHSVKKHIYAVSNTMLSADVVISLPKMKVHKKAGVSLNLKNMMGVCCDKRYIPHFNSSDEMPEGCKNLTKFSKRKMIESILSGEKLPANLRLKDILNDNTVDMLPAGDWHGNDTIWRAILDINNIVKFADKKGKMKKIPQRKFFSIIDGIISGEKEGPLNPVPINTGVVIAGQDFTEVDLAAIKLMGFDYKKIPQYKNLVLGDVVKKLSIEQAGLSFKPPSGWKGHIEEKND